MDWKCRCHGDEWVVCTWANESLPVLCAVDTVGGRTSVEYQSEESEDGPERVFLSEWVVFRSFFSFCSNTRWPNLLVKWWRWLQILSESESESESIFHFCQSTFRAAWWCSASHCCHGLGLIPGWGLSVCRLYGLLACVPFGSSASSHRPKTYIWA